MLGLFDCNSTEKRDINCVDLCFLCILFSPNVPFWADLLWTSPELLREFCNLDGIEESLRYKVDVYSYGIILSEIVNRTSPYAEDLERALLPPGGE